MSITQPLFEVPVTVQGRQVLQVHADDAIGARLVAHGLDQAAVAATPVVDLAIVDVGEAVQVADDLLPDIDTLRTSGQLLASRIGHQVHRLRGQVYTATWITAPGSPRWVIAVVTPEQRPALAAEWGEGSLVGFDRG